MTGTSDWTSDWTSELLRMFREQQIVRTKHVYEAGIPTIYLTRLVRDGTIRRVCHATYVLVNVALPLDTVLREIATRMPTAIASLGTAAAVHGLEPLDATCVHVTLPLGSRPASRVAFPVEAFWERPRAYGLQVAERDLGAVVARVYGPEKTVADFFKYRNRVGISRALRVLDAYLVGDRRDVDTLHRCASANRMTNVMEPFVRAWHAFRGRDDVGLSWSGRA